MSRKTFAVQQRIFKLREVGGARAALARKKERHEVYGEIPYGFRAVDGKLEPNTDEQGILRRMRRLWANGMSCQKLADALNASRMRRLTSARLWRGAPCSIRKRNLEGYFCQLQRGES